VATPPPVCGNIEAVAGEGGLVVAGDPAGLRSLAQLLVWLADLDQEGVAHLPEGERAHVHLYPGSQTSGNSVGLELCRLDAKGTGMFPGGFEGADEEARGVAYPEWFLDDSESIR
jgi:hypothetical protein